MASVFDRNGNYTAGMDRPEPEPGQGQGATWGDVGRRGASAVTEVGGQAASLTQYMLEQFGMPNGAKIAQATSQLMHVGTDIAEEGITPGGQRAHGVQGFKEAPFSTFLMEGAGIAPQIAIFSLVPGGFIGEGIAGGTMLAGQVVDQAIAKSNNLSDAQKQDRIPYYKYLRQDKGLSEDDAVANYHRALVPYKTLATATLIGAATNGMGARLLKNGAIIGTGGRLRGAVEAGTEAGVGGGVAAGTADVAQQQAESVEKSKTGEAGPTDWNRTLSAVMEGAATTGPLGAGGGALHGGKTKEPKVTIEPAEEAPPTAPATPPAPLTPAVSTDANMQPPSGLQHELDLQPPKVAPTAPAPSGQQDLFAPPTGDAANPPVETPPPPPSAEAVPTGADTGTLPLKPPAYAPTAPAPEGQGDLFGGARVTVEPLEPVPDAPEAAPAAGAPPTKSLADIQAGIEKRKAEIDAATAPKAPGAVDTSTEAPAAAPAAEAAAPAEAPAPPPPPKRARKAKPTVQTVDAAGPDAGQSAALEASGVGAKPPEAPTPPAAEAVPTTPAPPVAADRPPSATDGVPDEHTDASQPPKGTGTGAAAPPPGAGDDVSTTKFTKKPKGVGPKGKKAVETAAPARGEVPPPPPEVPEAEAAALTPEVSQPAPPEPAPAQPAPPPPIPAQAAPPPAAPVPQRSLADLLQEQQARPPEPVAAQPTPAPAPVTPAPVRAPEPAPTPEPAAAPKSLDQLLREQQGGAPAEPAPTPADLPTPDAQAVAATEPAPQAVTTPRVLEGGSAAPAFDAARQAEVKQASDAALSAGERGDKTSSLATFKPLSEMTSAEQKNVRRSATIEANAAVAKAQKEGKQAHPIHQEIAHQAAVLKSMGQGGGMSPAKRAQSAKVMAAVEKLRRAREPGGELGPRTKADVNVGGAPTAKVGEITRRGTPVTETVRATMDKAAEGRARKKAEREVAVRKADADEAEVARQRALADAREKPMTPEVRKHVEMAAHDPNRTSNERATASRMLEVDDDKVARQKEAQNRFVQPAAPEHVPTAKERAVAARQAEPPPHPGASPKEWRDWLNKTLDVETREIERGGFGSGRSGEGPYRELGEEETGVHELGEGDEGYHEGERPAFEHAVANEPLVNDPKGFARIAMQMQLQDAREMTRHENQGVLPIRISRRVKPARSLTVDQLREVRDNKTLSKDLREYASTKIADLLDEKPKKITTPREPKAKVTPEVKRPEMASAKKVDGIWKPTVGGEVLAGRPPYTTFKDAFAAAQAEARHRIEPTEATRPSGIKEGTTALRVEGMRKSLRELNAERASEVAAKTKEANGKQSLLDRKALAAEAKAAGLSVKDFRAKLSTEIKETRAEVEATKADIDKTNARIKELTPYLEHPATLRQRAEEVEEAAASRKSASTGPAEGSGGARLGGRKSLDQIYRDNTPAPKEEAGTSDVLQRTEKAFDEGSQAGHKKSGDYMSEKSDRKAAEREKAQRKELEKAWAQRIEAEHQARQAARDKANAELDAEIERLEKRRYERIAAAGGPENFVTQTRARRLLKEVGWEPGAITSMIKNADIDELHKLIDYAEKDLQKRADAAAREAAATGRVTVDMHGKKMELASSRTTNIRDALNDPDVIGHVHGLTRTGNIATAVMKKVQALAGDVPVHYVSRAEMIRLAKADYTAEKGMVPAGYYDNVTHQILINSDLIHPEDIAHTIFHEAVHAATSRMIDDNPGLKTQIRAIMDEAELLHGADQPSANKYAFTNEKEFLAEAFSNKSFRDDLASIDISPELKRALAIEGWRKTTGFKAQLKSLWDAFKLSIAHAFGEPKATSFLEATLSTTERIIKAQERDSVPVENLSRPTTKALEDNADPEKVTGHYMKMPDALHDVGEKLSHLEPGAKGQKLGFGIRTSDQLRQAYEHRFGARTESNPLRNFTESIEKAGVKAHVYNREGQALARRVYELTKNDKTKEAAIEFAKLAEAATIHNVHLDRANDHIDPASLDHAQARAALPALKARFEAMVKSAPETRALWRDAVDYFQKTHDAMAKDLIDNHLELIDDAHTAVGGVAGLKQRLFDGTATADDMKLFSRGQADSFAQMREIHKMEGAYFPLMRRGDFAVRATMKVDPGKGQKIGENTIQFTDEAQAHAYAKSSPLKVNRTSEVFVDKNNPEQRVSKNNPDAVKAYRIEVQHEHLSFHEKEHQARDMQAELKADPSVAKVSDVQLRQNNPGYDVEMSSPQVQAIIRSIRQNASMSDAKKEEMIRSWIDVSHRLVAGNRVESRRIPRRNVLGASQDLGRNLEEYSQSTSAYRAKLEFAHPIHDALARMQKEHDDNRYSGDNQATLDRGNVIREMTDRLYGGLADMNTKTNGLVQAVTTTSYLKSMGSPAHMLLHSTHPWMISMPVLGARHGFAKATGALTGAYRDMGGLGAVKEGMKSFARSVASGGTSEAKNWLDHFEAEFHGKDKADIVKMWRALAETGHIHPEAGMEAHRMDPGQVNPVLAGLRRVDAMVRELSSTSEALNRFAESAAAYRLERLKGKTHEEAVRYAKDTLANTQGLYSRTNVPRVFRTNQLLRMTLQFKQFPQMIYNLLAKSAYQAFKGETPEIRREAMRQFAGVVGTHALMAGALGLPTEPIRAVMMLANAMGVPGMDWKEHEDQMTKWLAAKYGPQAAEIIMHGLTRALGSASFDAHHRLGLGTVAMGMDPRSTSEADLKAWAFDTFLGAPAGNAYDIAIKGPSELMSGNTAKGLQDMSPLKGITDPIKAVSGYLWGKQTARGNQMSPPLNGVQTFVQSIGLVPAAVSQANAATASVKETQFREGRERTALINQAIGGKMSGADIARWNYAHPDRKISYANLASARRENALPQALGQKVNKANRSLIDMTSRAYNLGGVQ